MKIPTPMSSNVSQIGLVAFGLCLLITSCTEPAANKSLFEEVVFDREAIAAVGNHPDHPNIRFYNVRRDANDRAGTIMAVPVDLQGKELRQDAKGNGYFILSDRYDGDHVMIRNLQTEEARQACRYVIDANGTSYVTEMPAKDLHDLMARSNGNAIAIRPIYLSRDLSMSFEGGTLREGRFQGAGTEHLLECGRPCPRACVSLDQYVNQ